MTNLITTLAVTDRDPEQVRDAAREILQRREFRDEESFAQRLRDWLADPLAAIDRLLDRLQLIFGGGDGAVAATIAWVFAFLVAALVIFLVVRFAKTTTSTEVENVVEPVRKLRNTDELLSEAKRFEENGDWRRAIRARHAALVVALAEKGILRRQPGMTAREYAFEVSTNAPAAYVPFDAATSMFEWAWYGDGKPGEGDVAQFKEFAVDVQKKAGV